MAGAQDIVEMEVQDAQGSRPHYGQVGDSLLVSLQKAQFEIASICGGSMICTLCHVHVSMRDGETPLKRSDHETSVLSEKPAYDAEMSRLACQVEVTSCLNGCRIVVISQQ